jgi:hypothetical protein
LPAALAFNLAVSLLTALAQSTCLFLLSKW